MLNWSVNPINAEVQKVENLTSAAREFHTDRKSEKTISTIEIQKVENSTSAAPEFRTDRKSEKIISAIEEPSTTSVKTLLCILLLILVTLTCVSLVGVIWFGPRWPTYEITYIIQVYLLKIGVPLPAILVTMSVFVTLAIGISTYLCCGSL